MISIVRLGTKFLHGASRSATAHNGFVNEEWVAFLDVYYRQGMMW